MPPVNSIIEGIDALLDAVWVFWSQFCGIEAGYHTNERQIALNIVAPFVLTQTPAEDMVKL